LSMYFSIPPPQRVPEVEGIPAPLRKTGPLST
jgi:hypothetical protein